MVKKTWQEKMKTPKEGQIKQTDKGMMYISTPKEIRKIISSIPKGKLMTTTQIVHKLAKKHKVDFTCGLTTGIFVGVVANYTEEERSLSQKDAAPYWRVIKPKGYLYPKYLGQKSLQRQYLEAEKFKIIPSGTKKGPVVKDFEKHLV